MALNESRSRGLGAPGAAEVVTPASTIDSPNGTAHVKIEDVTADGWASLMLEDRSRQRTVTVTLHDGETAGHQVLEDAPSRRYILDMAKVLLEALGRRR